MEIERPLRGLECKRDILQADESKCWLPMRLGRWCCYFEIAWTHYQTNSGGGDCSEWVNGKMWGVSVCVHQGGRHRHIYLCIQTQMRSGCVADIQSFHCRRSKAEAGDSKILQHFISSETINLNALMLCCYGTKAQRKLSTYLWRFPVSRLYGAKSKKGMW